MASPVKNLASNVCRGKIFGFVTAPVIVAAILIILLKWNEIFELLFFGAFTVCWGIYFPTKWGILPPKATDFWYYILGSLGVILFFVNANEERERISLSQAYNLRQIELSTFLDKRQVIELIFLEPEVVLDTIKRNAAITNRNLSSIRSECNQAQFRRTLSEGQGDFQDKPRPAPLDLNFVDPMCELLLCSRLSIGCRKCRMPVSLLQL